MGSEENRGKRLNVRFVCLPEIAIYIPPVPRSTVAISIQYEISKFSNGVPRRRKLGNRKIQCFIREDT